LEVYLRYSGSGTWLRIKEVYALQSSGSRRRRSRQQPKSSPYGIVAESVDKPNIRGYRFHAEVKVPAMKVSRFAARAFLVKNVDAVVVIEEESLDSYKATVYAKSKAELENAVGILMEIVSSLQAGRRRGTEEEEESVEEAEAEEVEEE
jgi:hypothetical protein